MSIARAGLGAGDGDFIRLQGLQAAQKQGDVVAGLLKCGEVDLAHERV